MDEKMMKVVVIGASAGGLEALKTIVSNLRADLPAAVFIVQHAASSGNVMLADILASAGPLPARLAKHGEPYRQGVIYVAPANFHLLLRNGLTILSKGPRENSARPSIDPLFRSAATSCRSRAIGVLLSGLLSDGVSGLDAIKRCGGQTIVIDPDTVIYPDMPRSAIRSVEVDHCLPLPEMAPLLSRLAREAAPPSPEVPEDLKIEVLIAEKKMNDTRATEKIGDPSSFACPDCGGPLWQLDDPKIARYRCNVGHAFTEPALLNGQTDAVEKALWVALRTLEDRSRMLQGLLEKAKPHGLGYHRYHEHLEENSEHIAQIKKLLFDSITMPAGALEAAKADV